MLARPGRPWTVGHGRGTSTWVEAMAMIQRPATGERWVANLLAPLALPLLALPYLQDRLLPSSPCLPTGPQSPDMLMLSGLSPFCPSPPILAHGLRWCGGLRPVSATSTALHHPPVALSQAVHVKASRCFWDWPPPFPSKFRGPSPEQGASDWQGQGGPWLTNEQPGRLAVSRLRAPSRHKRRTPAGGLRAWHIVQHQKFHPASIDI